MSRLSRLIPILCLLASAAACARISPSHTRRPGDSHGSIVGERRSSYLVGDQFDYSVRAGDTLHGIGARFGVSPKSLAARNQLTGGRKLVPRQVLRVSNHHIVPAVLENGILINLPQRVLFYFEGGEVAAWYPIAIGQPDWQTPTGSHRVLTREEDPTWEVPVSIQREMRRKGEKVRTRVPPGPDNPLGKYWLGLSMTCCGIHGTNAPQSIYTFQTHGCIRLSAEGIADLFSRVSAGTPVEIIYEPVLFASDRDGAVYLEVHPDVYRRTRSLHERAKEVAESRGLRSASGSPLWDDALRNQEGIAIRLPG